MSDTCDAPGAEEVTCQPGFNTLECCWLQANLLGSAVRQCAQYNNTLTPPAQLHWLLGVAFATMALMSFGIGANDAANSWGTSVGSGAVQLKWAVIVGGLMDWLGAATLGAGARDKMDLSNHECSYILPVDMQACATEQLQHIWHLRARSRLLSLSCRTRPAGVSDTIRNEITDVQAPACWACGYCDSKMSLYMLGMTAALLATAVFLILSSATSMPVSTTHAVVGAVLGVTAAGTAPSCLKWKPLGRIAASWVVSPLLAGAVGSGLYALLQRFVILSSRALRPSWRSLSTVAFIFCHFVKSGAAAQVSLLQRNKSGQSIGTKRYWPCRSRAACAARQPVAVRHKHMHARQPGAAQVTNDQAPGVVLDARGGGAHVWGHDRACALLRHACHLAAHPLVGYR